MEQLERSDIQGIALYSYSNLSCAAYAMLRVVDPPAARGWLGRLADEITTADGPRSPSINLAVTYGGLEQLGLDSSALATFAHAFRDGMASERRARILGDDGPNSSAGWDWGRTSRPVDVLLMLYAEDQGPLDDEIARRRAEWTAGGLEEVTTLVAGRQPDSKEHFGFLDGVGQPTIEGSDTVERQLARTGHATPLKPGEFLLSYTDTYDKPAPSPLVDPALDPDGHLPDTPRPDGALRRDLGRNGSYLVFRQLAQDVAAFWGFLDHCTRGREDRSDPEAQVRLGAKMVGRWPSGAPLVKAPDRDPHAGVPPERDDNDFEYDATDRYGFACPIGSHIRRANPRDALGPDPQTALESARRHRLMRRGRSYGDRLKPQLVGEGGQQVPRFVDDGAERGLHFICLNSDVERQFEFVQQTWVNNPVFGGLYDETDPLIGQRGPNGSGGTLTVQADPLRTRVHGLGHFVTVRGGAYFFLPGLRALRYLASLGQ
jgi:Dyp-type peroxidase family